MAETIGLAMARRAAGILDRYRDTLTRTGDCAEPDPVQLTSLARSKPSLPAGSITMTDAARPGARRLAGRHLAVA